MLRAATMSIVLAAASAWAGPALPPAPPEEPLPAAQRHLRLADEYLRASCEMLGKCDRHAIDGYYVACQEAWNAAQTCPRSADILAAAAEAYADALAGFLEAACRHGRIADGGVWVGPPGRLVKVPFAPQATVDLGGSGSHTVPICSYPGFRPSISRRAIFRCAVASPYQSR